MESPSEIFESWHARMLGDPSVAGRVGGPIRITLDGLTGGSWILQGGSSPSVRSVATDSGGSSGERCTVRLSAQDFMALVRRELNPQVAFLTGRISVEGDFNDALTLAPLME